MAEFGNLNLEELQSEDQRLNSDAPAMNSFLDQFVPMPNVKAGQKGTVSVRLLPPLKGERLFQYNRTHKVNERSVHCPRPLVNGKWDRNVPCPICDYYSSLWRKADRAEKQGNRTEADNYKDEARLIKPVERYYYNAIVRTLTDENGNTTKNAGPRILSVGKVLHKKIIRALFGEDGDADSKLGNVTDLKAGYDFVIRKEVTTGTDNFPKYDDTTFARQPSPAGTPEEIQSWIENIIDLSKLRNPKATEEIERELAIHRGLIQDETTGFDTDDFDKRWREKAGDQVDAMTETSTDTSQTEATAQAASSEVAAETAAVADVPIEDEDFLAELDAMDG